MTAEQLLEGHKAAFEKLEQAPSGQAGAAARRRGRSLSIIVVITDIGVRAKTMNPDVAAGLIGAGLLAVLLCPTIAGVTLKRIAAPHAAGSSA
jgi:hypothetical protein